MNLPTTIIIKTTNSCNSACIYCYEDNNYDSITHVIKLSYVEKIYKWALDSNLTKVQLVWHGGEPLLAGRPFFEKVIKLQEKYSRTDLEVLQSIQTNCSLIDDSWIEFLRDEKFGIGISLDGPKWLNDRHRRLLCGKSSHDQVINSLKHLIDNSISVGISCVVTKHSLNVPEELIRYFSTLPANSVDFLPMTILADRLEGNDNLISPEEFTEFMEKAFCEWMSLPDDRIMVRYFENLIRGVCGLSPNLCTFSGRCGEYISIDHDGSVYPCDSFMRDSALKFGSLENNNLDEILAQSLYREFQKGVSRLPDRCNSCEYLQVCNAGCPSERYFRGGTFSSDYIFCDTRKVLARRFMNYLSDYDAKNLINLKIV